MQNSRRENLRIAEHGAWVAIFAYIALSALNLIMAQLTHSASLRANGFNNLTDILGNLAIVVGLRMARVPADGDHVYGHWKVESIASLITSFIMAVIGFEILRDTVLNFITPKETPIDPVGAWIGVLSAAVMIGVYIYNHRLAKKVESPALLAAAKDNLSDAATSLGTTVAILATLIHLPILDKIMALIIAGFILWTAYEIFRDSAFSLSDGFDEKLLVSYRTKIEQVDKVWSVKSLRGRMYGANIFLDVVIEMSPDMSVFESHTTTEEIETLLRDEFQVFDTDVHVEPAVIPDDSKPAALALKLLALEEDFIHAKNLSALTGPDYTSIGISISADRATISHYRTRQISMKTIILTYEGANDTLVTAVWRRRTTWQCIYRHTSKKEV
ncbi:MAG: cation diffusion facilitator family transporter [Streptococcaceae bacterium]|jgi:cation diffusion facilitator family transporter|nr:cation diffusion facilitator family transporter [Streptococcaceae bacterium]